jgi:hypothetical protein
LPERGLTETPRETFLALIHFFKITDEKDIHEFFTLFPKDIQKEIKNSVLNY